MDSCAACGCEIVNEQTAAGTAVRHLEKTYCAECAAMIVPPEMLEKLSKPVTQTATAVISSGGVMGGDDILAEAPPEEPPAVAPAPKRDTAVERGARRPSTRATGRAPTSRRMGTTAMPRNVPGAGTQDRFDSAREARARKRRADSTGLYIGIGVGAVALVLIAIFVFSQKQKPPKTNKPPVVAAEEDKTPSGVYAKQAEDLVAKRDFTGAARMYSKAAERAEKEGNKTQAQAYIMQIKNLEQNATLSTTGNK